MSAKSLSMDLFAMHMTLNSIARRPLSNQEVRRPTDLTHPAYITFSVSLCAGLSPWPLQVSCLNLRWPLLQMQGPHTAGSSQSLRVRLRQIRRSSTCRGARCCRSPRMLRASCPALRLRQAHTPQVQAYTSLHEPLNKFWQR